MRKLGLLGYPLGHSFSKTYYLDKFARENIHDVDYDLYSFEHIEEFIQMYENDPSFVGFNVTIPHKQAVAQIVDELSPEAEAMHAVNCVTIERSEQGLHLKGYNTDAYGFECSLMPLLREYHEQALVLGNGGAAKAVIYTLQKLGISHKVVSRSEQNGDLVYDDLTAEILAQHLLIVNCSPVGTFPDIDQAPNIPYDALSDRHLLYDLIYNPEETLFLKRGRLVGATTKNGYEMLLLQAERNWEIWNNA